MKKREFRYYNYFANRKSFFVGLLVSVLYSLFAFSAFSQTTLATFNFDNDTQTSWTYSTGNNSWEIGVPNGGQGVDDSQRRSTYIGNADPTIDNTSGNTINQVAGQGLSASKKKEGVSGHYNSADEWIQSPVINCANYYNVTLEYYRWANFETGYDLATIEVSSDGVNWDVVYSPETLQDNAWTKHTLDISKYADRQATVYIRWRSVSDYSIYYAGWNIDDITITGVYNTNDYTSTITAGSITPPTTISSLVDTYVEKVTVGEFTISDLASGDNLPTIIDTLVILPGSNNTVADWKKAITNIYLYDANSGTEITGKVEPDRISFSNSNVLSIPDGSSVTFELSFYVEVKLVDTDDNSRFEFSLDYGNQIMNPFGSFISSGVVETGASNLQLDIAATELSFLVEPEQLVSANRNLLPYIQIAATDANGNVDMDYSGNITLSNSGSLLMSGVTEATTNGIATFNALQFTETGGPVTLTTSHTGSVSIPNATTSVSVTIQANLNDVIFFDNFDNSGITGWTTGAISGSSSWETGNPNGGKGYSSLYRSYVGNADPTVDYTTDNTINNVWGQGLSRKSRTEGVSGYYNSSNEWLMSPAIDLSTYYNTELRFMRWANVEAYYDEVYVEISQDGTNWIQLDHPLYPSDTYWTEVAIDISTYADRQSTVYIRWRTDSDESVPYAGWNIDDVEINGIFSPITEWTGTTSTDWNTASNWSANSVPTELSNVYINSGTPNRPIVSSTAVCNEMIIKKNAILEVDNSGNLTVYGDVSIETDSKNYGALIDKGAINIQGKGKISRYLTGDQWHFISSPISNSISTDFGEDVYSYDEVEASRGWLQGWVLAENTSLEMAKGYDVYKYKNSIAVLEGDFNTGNYGVSLSNTDGYESADHEGWNFVGNPYPSAIDWDAASGWTKTGINNAIYIWDESQQNYISYVDGAQTNNGSNYIPPMQGFFVKVTNPGSAYLGMTNNVRVANIDSKLKASGNATVEGLNIRISDTSYSDETIVRFINGASEVFDGDYDAQKRFSDNNMVPQIYTLTTKSEQLAINSQPENSGYSVIPVSISTASSGNFVLDFSGINNIDASQTIYIEDLILDSIINVRSINTYSFYSEVVSQSNRFILHIGMPLQITYSVNEVSEFGLSDGSIDIEILGGKQPLTNIVWSNGATTEDLNGVKVGQYIVTITDNAENRLVDTIMVYQKGATTISEADDSELSHISVFGNKEELHIVPSDITTPIDNLKIYDLSGRLVFENTNEIWGEAIINLDVMMGVYIMDLSQDGVNHTEKIVLK